MLIKSLEDAQPSTREAPEVSPCRTLSPVYETLKAERANYEIRLPANAITRVRISIFLTGGGLCGQ
jgi:hypothetical protein